MFPSILIVDDEAPILRTLGGILQDEGFEVITAQNGYEALQMIGRTSPDLVLLDIWMPGLDGIDTLKEIRRDNPNLPVVLITGHGSVETAVQAIKLGAYDFIEKPLSFEKVVVTINNALNFRRLEEENRYLRKKTLEKYSITGTSPLVMEMLRQIEIAAPTQAWVLITGENGTGKELVARTIHQLSDRSEQAMVTVNCAAADSRWLEDDLFGHEKGAFKGAAQRKQGKIELANKGTLFFDDIGDMDIKIQGKLLQVLESKVFTRLGGGRDITIDVRVIAATNRNLEDLIESGLFREELYYRLNVIPIRVPPLRERTPDIGLLMDQFFARLAQENTHPKKKLSPQALEVLMRYPWPGNVRELKNLAERLVITIPDDVILAEHIPASYRDRVVADALYAASYFEEKSFDEAVRKFEKAYINSHLVRHNLDERKTAKALGLDVKTLRQKAGL
jgi:two-component system nitrogen regulation response regulator NtrX